MKNKQNVYEKLVEMSRDNNFITGNLLAYFCHQIYYKPIVIDLSRHTNTSIPRQINFTDKLEEDDGGPIFF